MQSTANTPGNYSVHSHQPLLSIETEARSGGGPPDSQNATYEPEATRAQNLTDNISIIEPGEALVNISHAHTPVSSQQNAPSAIQHRSLSSSSTATPGISPLEPASQPAIEDTSDFTSGWQVERPDSSVSEEFEPSESTVGSEQSVWFNELISRMAQAAQIVQEIAELDRNDPKYNEYLRSYVNAGHTEPVKQMIDKLPGWQYDQIRDELELSAAQNGDLEMVKTLTLLDTKSPPSPDSLTRMVGAAILSGNEAVIDYLLNQVSHFTEQFETEFSPGACAVKVSIQSNDERYRDIIPKLQEKGSSLNYRFKASPLHYAVTHQRLDIVKYLLEKGCSPDAGVIGRFNPLNDLFTQYISPSLYPSFTDIGKLTGVDGRLLAHMANHFVQGATSVKSSLLCLFEFMTLRNSYNQAGVAVPERPSFESVYHTAQILLENGADPNGRVFSYSPSGFFSNNQPTPLHQLVAYKLYQLEADRNGHHGDAVCLAQECAMEFISLLLTFRADPNGNSVGKNTPLYMAASKGDHGLTKLLLANGADPNAKVLIPSVSAEGNPFSRFGMFGLFGSLSRYEWTQTPLYTALNNKHYHVAHEIYNTEGCADPRDILAPGSDEYDQASTQMDSMYSLTALAKYGVYELWRSNPGKGELTFMKLNSHLGKELMLPPGVKVLKLLE